MGYRAIFCTKKPLLCTIIVSTLTQGHCDPTSLDKNQYLYEKDGGPGLGYTEY